jgi:hypothetical protein
MWAVTSGTLPPGLTLSSTGALTGTPATKGSYTFTVQASDAKATTASRQFSISVGAALIITSTQLQDATLGSMYRQSLTAAGGAAPYLWCLTSGQLPTGLILLASGDIIGQPTQSMTATFTVTVTDSAQPASSASRTFNLTVEAGFAITTATLPHAAPGVPYLTTITAINGAQPYTWTIPLGSLPQGISFSTTGAISGTPTKPGAYPLLIQATDSSNPALTTTRQLMFIVDTDLSVTTPTLSNGVVSDVYSSSLAAANGVPPYIWSADVLPPGLALLPTGELYGIPTAAGEYTLTFTVTDQSQPIATASRILRLLVTRDLAITTGSLPSAVLGKPYSIAITAVGGNPPYVFSSSGLPAGMSLDPTGIISGMPANEGSYTITVTIVDQSNTSIRVQLTLAVGATLSVSNSTLPTATTGTLYFAFLSATGGTVPYTWTVDNLPSGLRLIPSIGLIVGTPTTAGDFTITATAIDSAQSSRTASATIELPIASQLAISTPDLPPAQTGAAYTTTLGATGGTAPYNWSADTTTLPAGLTLDPNGAFQGTINSAPGAFSLSICVSDSATPAAHACGIRTLVAGPAFQIDPLTIKPTARGQAISYHFTATGGQGTVLFASAFPLPSGLSLADDGTLTGSPSTSGSYTLSILATDNANRTAAHDFSLTVLPPLMATTTTLPRAILGGRYATALSATSGTPPYTWTLGDGSLPSGITLDSAGFLFGSPTAAGSSSATLTVTDSLGQTATLTVTLTVAPALSIATSSLPDALVKSPYAATLTPLAGSEPYVWTVVAGQLPDGLALSTDGALSGTPTATGLYAFVVSVTDASGQVAGAAFTLHVTDTLSVPNTSTTLADGVVGVGYSAQLTTSYASGVTWALILGDLAPGLTLYASGAISGTPTAAGAFQFVARATAGAQHVDQLYSLRIAAPPTGKNSTPTLTDQTLATAYVARPYTATLNATGGTTPYAWSIAGGALPDGLSFTSGAITGTPTVAGIFRFIIALSDASNQRTDATYTLIVRQGLATDGALALDQPLNTPVKITLNAAGGVPPYAWSLSTGSLPTGLAISGANIAGTTTAAGVYTATLTVRDSDQPQQAGSLAVVIRVTTGLSITTTTLPTAYPQVPYNASFAATGGDAPYRWTLSSGALPAGLTLTTDGIIHGTPTAQGSYPITVSVADAGNQHTSASLTLTVASLVITTTFLPAGTFQTRYYAVLEATGGAAPYRWTITSGTLPAGLALTPEGLISGTPTSVTKAAVTFQVSDADSATASTAFDIVIVFPTLGSLRFGSLPDPINPASQNPITLSIETATPIDLTGAVSLQLTPVAAGHDDDSATLLRANGSAGRTLSFTIPAASKAAVFETGSAQLQSGTLAGSLTLSATIAGGQNTPAATAVTHVLASAPVITGAKVTSRDKYSMEIEVTGYSTTAEIHTANFVFAGSGTLPPPQTLSVQALFDAWYLSQAGKQQGGVFTYTQKFNFTAAADGLTSVTITLTNAIAPSTPYKLTF